MPHPESLKSFSKHKIFFGISIESKCIAVYICKYMDYTVYQKARLSAQFRNAFSLQR